ncbi:MAG: extracellular solute-binding protein [Oscillospiraceae bacterium]|nr:extracellular solute-binding protein [Oscillospiraceae bacterium]
MTKTGLKRFMCLLLAGLMLLSLCACGKGGDDGKPSKTDGKGEKTENTTENEENLDPNRLVYTASYTPVKFPEQLGGMNYVNFRTVINGKMLVSSYGVVADNTPEGVTPEYEGEYWEYGDVYYLISADGTVEPFEMKPYKYEGIPDNAEYSGCYLNTSAFADDGTRYESYNVYWEIYTGKRNPDGSLPDDAWNYMDYHDFTILRITAPDGTENVIDLCEALDLDYCYINSIVADDNGNAYFCFDTSLVMVKSDGTAAVIDAGGGWVEGLMMLNGKLAVFLYEDSGMVCKYYDAEKGTFSDPVKIPNDAYNAIPGAGEYDMFIQNGTSFYGYKIETGEKDKIFSWMSLDVDPYSVGSIVPQEDGSFITFSSSWDDDANGGNGGYSADLIKVYQCPASQLKLKKSITYACNYLNYSIREAIFKFNKTNPDYRIEVIDYSEYNTDEDYTYGITKLKTEIMAGKVPDIIQLDNLPVSTFEDKGILADLYEFMENDAEVNRDTLVADVLAHLENDGHLYKISPDFSVRVFYGLKKVVGDKPGWSYADFAAAYRKLPAGANPLTNWYTKFDAWPLILNANMAKLLDDGTGKCAFDSQLYKDTLSFVSMFPEIYDWSTADGVYYDNDVDFLREGKQLLLEQRFYDTWSYEYFMAQAGDEICPVGIPVSEGVGNFIEISNGLLGISAASPSKDAAWEFVRSLLTYDYQRRNIWNLPLNAQYFEENLEQLTRVDYEINYETGEYLRDENGELVKVPHGYIWNRGSGSIGIMRDGGIDSGEGENIPYYEMSAEQVQAFRDIIKNAYGLYNGYIDNDEIAAMIMNDSAPYFDGSKSLDEIAKILQSKMSIYLAEQE